MGDGRRGFLKAVIGLGSAAVGAIVAVPGVAYLLDPLLRRRKGSTEFRPLAALSTLRDERPVPIDVVGDKVDAWTRAKDQRLGTVWLRKKDEQVVALSAECPHLGCRIGYDKDADQFACPCHESAFALDGGVLGGPSPRGMDPLETRVRDGIVEVRFQRYRTQTEEREEIG